MVVRPPNWMLWNLFLAGVPLALGLLLFHLPRRRTVGWWCLVVMFVAFLPNAPYVLSDAVHVVPLLRADPSWDRALLILTGFALFFLAGMEFYVLSLASVRHYLQREGLGRYTVPVLVGLHAASAAGVYLGRVARFNSWDLLHNGHLVLGTAYRSLLRPWTLALVGLTFAVILVGYEVLQRVNLLAILAILAIRAGGRRPAP